MAIVIRRVTGARAERLAAVSGRGVAVPVPACASCHGLTGAGSATLPRLAGQHAAYLENQLKQFHQRARNNDNAVMHTVAEKMTALEMAAVAEYLSGQ